MLARPAWVLPAVVVAGVNALFVAAVLVGLGPALLALLFVVPGLIAIANRPQRGLLVLTALAPFNGLLLIIPHPGIANGWKEALVLVTLAGTFVAPAEAKGAAGRQLPTWVAPTIGLLLVGLASGVAVGGLQAAIGLKIGFFYILVALSAWRCPLDARERDHLVTILMATGVITGAIGILQQFIGPARLNALGYQYNEVIRFAGGYMRSFSTFIQPFPFGFYMMLVMLIGIAHVLTDPKRPRNRLFLFLLPVCGIGMLSTIVRASWLGFAAGVAYLGVNRYRVLLLTIPLGLLALAFVPADTSSSALSSSSSHERAQGWQRNFGRFVAHPMGIGIGSTGSAALKVSELRGGQKVYQSDNYYFRTLLELGVLGLWMLLLVIGSAFATTRFATSGLDPPDTALVTGVGAAILAAAVAAIFSAYFEIFPMDLLFWLLLGVVSATVMQRSSSTAVGLSSASR
jgi:hypothetical protein